nr:uncharacterized protein LOC120974751 [Aegilops tauschii subsp. strangulata]
MTRKRSDVAAKARARKKETKKETRPRENEKNLRWKKKSNPIPFSPNHPAMARRPGDNGLAQIGWASGNPCSAGPTRRDPLQRPPPRWMRHCWLVRCGEVMYSSSAASRPAPPRRRGGAVFDLSAAYSLLVAAWMISSPPADLLNVQWGELDVLSPAQLDQIDEFCRERTIDS